jgi:ribosome-associated protein
VTDPAAPSARPTRVRAKSPSPTSPTTTDPITTPKPKPATTKATTKASTTKVGTPKPKAAKAAPAKAATKPKAATRPKAAPAKAAPAKTKAPESAADTKPRLGLPARDKPLLQDRKASLAIARRIVELAEDKKAADIVMLDLGELTTIADAFVICSGGSERQLDAIADGIVSSLRDQGVRPIGREGVAASHWVLLDFGGVIVHIFTPPERDFYELEKHWSEARTVLRVQ